MLIYLFAEYRSSPVRCHLPVIFIVVTLRVADFDHAFTRCHFHIRVVYARFLAISVNLLFISSTDPTG